MAISLDNLRSVLGVFFVIGIAWLFSCAKTKIPVRIVLTALAIQISIGVILFAITPFRFALSGISKIISALQAATLEGAQFVFGYLAGGPKPFETTNPQNSFVLALEVLPIMIVISALSALLWHWGILSWICRGLGYLLRHTLALTGPMGLATATNVFLGMVETPLVIRPYLERMSKADIFLVMTTGMSTVAGTVMALYASLLNDHIPGAAGHILIASFMAAPGSVALARIMYPPEENDTITKVTPPPKLYQSSMDAFARGVQDGLNMFLYVIAIILTSVAIIALIDMLLLTYIPPVNGSDVSLGKVFGWVFSPIMFMLGIPWKDSMDAGMLMGTKTALNELLAYVELSKMGPDTIEPRTRLIMTYVLCGFASLGALAIMIGGLSTMCPNRRTDIIGLGFKSMLAGTLTTMLNGALIGIVPLAWVQL